MHAKDQMSASDIWTKDDKGQLRFVTFILPRRILEKEIKCTYTKVAIQCYIYIRFSDVIWLTNMMMDDGEGWWGMMRDEECSPGKQTTYTISSGFIYTFHSWGKKTHDNGNLWTIVSSEVRVICPGASWEYVIYSNIRGKLLDPSHDEEPPD